MTFLTTRSKFYESKVFLSVDEKAKKMFVGTNVLAPQYEAKEGIYFKNEVETFVLSVSTVVEQSTRNPMFKGSNFAHG